MAKRKMATKRKSTGRASGGSSRTRRRKTTCRFPSRRLTIKKILAWADAHHRRTGKWPAIESGPVSGAKKGETWALIHNALRRGHRGLPGGSSLARLLAKYRRARNKADMPRLTIKKILAWADAYHKRTGKWPSQKSGYVRGTSGETWRAINSALYYDNRGLRGQSSLSQLLIKRRNR